MLLNLLVQSAGTTIATYLLIANGLLATTYGWGEKNCGDIGKAVSCSKGAVTASGDLFDPEVANAAMALPTNIRMVKGLRLPLRIMHADGSYGTCHWMPVNDKMNPRYIGVRGWDLSPAAVNLLTGGKAHRKWSGKVQICENELIIGEKK